MITPQSINEKYLIRLADSKYRTDLPSYPVDISSLCFSSNYTIDANGVPYTESSTIYNPTTIAHYALAHWNQYLTTQDKSHMYKFLTQVQWLVEHEVCLGDDIGGWLIPVPYPDVQISGSCLSASAQGCGISVLIRGYLLTHDETLLEVIRDVFHTFQRDILDGGISAPLGERGVIFEDIAIYPAEHSLDGFIFALIALYDYAMLMDDDQARSLMGCSHGVLHSLLDEFDAGFWIYSNLRYRFLAAPHKLNKCVTLLEAFAGFSHCEHCSKVGSRWKYYQSRISSRLRYLVASRWSSSSRTLISKVRAMLFPAPAPSTPTPICVTVPSFPVMGGILTVLEGVEQVMRDVWHIEYLAQFVGSESERFIIHRFGKAKMSPWNFPLVWFYFAAGLWKLSSLLHRGSGYRVVLPQDGIYTSAFSALAAKLAGVRVVCIDHGDLSLFSPRNSHIYRTERIAMEAKKSWPWIIRLIARCCLEFYWPSRFLLARISAQFIDHFLIPGVAGDGVEEICKDLGIPASRITRYPSMIDVDSHVVPDTTMRAIKREEIGIPADAIVVAIICRLAPEKGLDIAIESISRALATVPPDIRARVRVVIAGDGPLYARVTEDIDAHGLSQTCMLWGKISATQVISLLGLSDIFLYTSMRGACFAMAILEAMASKCAVIASTEPVSNVSLLNDGRGFAVPPGDIESTSRSLVHLISNPELCQHMGDLARDYIATHHNASLFRRTLLRATYWSALDDIVNQATKREVGASEERTHHDLIG